MQDFRSSHTRFRGRWASWLAAALLMCVSAVMLVAWPRYWWIVGAGAMFVSQAVILTAWRDAWAGTLGNVVLLVAVVYGFVSEGPWSFRAQYDRDVAVGLAHPVATSIVTEADIAHLPEPVKRYLRGRTLSLMTALERLLTARSLPGFASRHLCVTTAISEACVWQHTARRDGCCRMESSRTVSSPWNGHRTTCHQESRIDRTAFEDHR